MTEKTTYKQVKNLEREMTRNKLRELGYDARCVNGDCYDIYQNGRIHYLSTREAVSLQGADIPHPVNLSDYAEALGLNLWYTFESDVEQ